MMGTWRARGICAVAAVLVLGACSDLKSHCETDGDCGAQGRCDARLQACVSRGGTDGGKDAGVDGGADAGSWALEWVAPAEGAKVGASVVLRAKFSETAGALPASLEYQAQAPSGGDGGTGSLSKQGDGTYQGNWSPDTEGAYQLVVRYEGAPVDGGVVESGVRSLGVDLSGPTLAVSVEASGVLHGVDGGTTYGDPAAGYGEAYRRDEVRWVRVTSSDSDVDGAGLVVKVKGDDGADGGASLVLAGGSGCDAGVFCQQVALDFAKPELKAFRGHFVVTAEGTDGVGNAATPASETVAVTRWKWRFDTGAGSSNNSASVAIGHAGTVYVGTTDPSAKLFAVSPDGVEKWAADAGSVTTTPTVGTAPDGGDRVYFPEVSGTDLKLSFLDGLGNVHSSPFVLANGQMAATSFALAPSTALVTMPSETAITVEADGSGKYLVAFRPDDAPGSQSFISVAVTPSSAEGALGADGLSIFYPVKLSEPNANHVEGYTLTSANWGLAQNYPAGGVDVGLVAPSVVVTGAGVAGGGGGAGEGGFFNLVKGALSWTWPNGSAFAGFGQAKNIIQDASGVSFGGVVGASTAPFKKLVRVTGAGSSALQTPSGEVTTAPVLGADGLLYTVDNSGVITAWNSADLTQVWPVPLDSGITAVTAPTLDCSRGPAGGKLSGRPGVLYFSSQAAKVYSVVVDSRGVDSTAGGWPAYLHDPRRTSNAQTDLSEFSCP